MADILRRRYGDLLGELRVECEKLQEMENEFGRQIFEAGVALRMRWGEEGRYKEGRRSAIKAIWALEDMQAVCAAKLVVVRGGIRDVEELVRNLGRGPGLAGSRTVDAID